MTIHLVLTANMDPGYELPMKSYSNGEDKATTFPNHNATRTLIKAITALQKSKIRKFTLSELAYFDDFWNGLDDKAKLGVRNLVESG